MIKLTEDQYKRVCEYIDFSANYPCNKCIIQCSGAPCVTKQKYNKQEDINFGNTKELIFSDKNLYIFVLDSVKLHQKGIKLKELQKEIDSLKKELNKKKKRLLTKED